MNPLYRRINYRNFKKDVYPSRDVVTNIVQDAITLSPFKGSMKYLDIDVWGPEHSKIKSDLVLNTGLVHSGNKRFQNKELDDEQWDIKMKEEYDKHPHKFNTQVEAPYLLAFTEDKIGHAHRVTFRPDKNVYMRWGMFMYSVVLCANNHGVDASYCSCFNMKITSKSNKLCTDYKKNGRDILSFIGLGYYDFDTEEDNWKRVDDDHIEHNLGGTYDIKNRKRDGCKSKKPTIDSMLRWRE